jgi:hypothetical protein
VINITVSTILVSAKVVFSLQQVFIEEMGRLIAESCQHLKKLYLGASVYLQDDDVIHIIKNLGKQLTTLALNGRDLSDVAYLYLNKCPR